MHKLATQHDSVKDRDYRYRFSDTSCKDKGHTSDLQQSKRHENPTVLTVVPKQYG